MPCFSRERQGKGHIGNLPGKKNMSIRILILQKRIVCFCLYNKQ
jgi:hypothetical protein